MSLRPTSLLAVVSILCLALAPRPARALFFAASRAIRAADAFMAQGIEAEEEGNRMDAVKAYESAINAYAEIRKKHPTASPDLVVEHQTECLNRLKAILVGAEAADADAATEIQDILATLPPEISTDDLPRNQVSTPPRRSTAEPSAKEMAPVEPPPVPTSTDAPPADLADRVAFYLRENRAAEAVLELDVIVGAEGDSAPFLHRLLLAKALVASGNNARAIVLLEPLAEEYPTDPAVLTLAAGANLAHGNAFAAVRHLDDLIRIHPAYADAYVDLAYARFAIDPDANRKEAIAYYRNALALGAERDPHLEDELRLRIAP